MISESKVRLGPIRKDASMIALVFAVTGSAPVVTGDVSAVAPQSCESLASRVFPNATITLARTVDAGTFAPPTPAGAAGTTAAAQVFRDLPPSAASRPR